MLKLVFACVFVLSCRAAFGDAIVAGHDWDPDPGAGDGFSANENALLSTQISGGPSNGLVNSFGTMQAMSADNMRISGFYPGAFTTNMWVALHFWQSNSIASARPLSWQLTTRSYIWDSDAAISSSSDTWTRSSSASLSYWDNWNADQLFGNEQEQFLSNLQSTEWMGDRIQWKGVDEKMHGLNDYDLVVPEPGECLFLIAALGVIFASRRKWFSGKAGGLVCGQGIQ